MTDERIKEEFEKGKHDAANTITAHFQSLIAGYDVIDKAAAIGFYMKCKVAERLAKIDVLEEMARMMDKLRFFSELDHKDAKDRIACMIADIEKYR